MTTLVIYSVFLVPLFSNICPVLGCLTSYRQYYINVFKKNKFICGTLKILFIIIELKTELVIEVTYRWGMVMRWRPVVAPLLGVHGGGVALPGYMTSCDTFWHRGASAAHSCLQRKNSFVKHCFPQQKVLCSLSISIAKTVQEKYKKQITRFRI